MERPVQRYVSRELTHFVGRANAEYEKDESKRLDCQYELFTKILQSGRLRAGLPPGVQPVAGEEDIPGRTVTFNPEKDLRCRVEVWHGDEAVLQVYERVQELARQFSIREVAYDPWRFRSEALRLEERGVLVVEFPQTAVRMVPASERLYAAVVEKRLRHPNDPDLNAHVARAIARQTPRGWKIDKANDRVQIDAVIALLMAVDRAEQPVRETKLLGWL